MKCFLLWARVVGRTSNLTVSRRRLAYYVKIMNLKAGCTCRNGYFSGGIQLIITLFCDILVAVNSRRRFLNSLITVLEIYLFIYLSISFYFDRSITSLIRILFLLLNRDLFNSYLTDRYLKYFFIWSFHFNIDGFLLIS